MISYETYCQIKDDHERQGLTVAQIATARGLHRHTVTAWLAQPHYRRRHRHPRASKLDPFKPEIIGWLQRHPLSATQVLQRLREQGYGWVYDPDRLYPPDPAPASAGLSEAGLRPR